MKGNAFAVNNLGARKASAPLVKLLFGISTVLLATGCIPLPPVPFTLPLEVNVDMGGFQGPMEFTIDAGSGHALVIPPDILVGMPIPNQPTDQMPLTDFPSEQDIFDLVDAEIQGSAIADMSLSLSMITLKSLRLQATSGNFRTITDVQIYFVPKPVGGGAQDPILIGNAASSTGFSTDIQFVPTPGVNFFELIQQNDDNPASGYPTAYLVATGTVPAVAPAWTTTVVVTADGAGSITTAPAEFRALPTGETINGMIHDAVAQALGSIPGFEWLAGLADLVAVTSLEVVGLNLTATSHDFSDFTEIRVFYIPKGGEVQDAIELGGAEAPDGFGNSITLAPPPGQTLDLLELVRENDANPAEGWPMTYLTVTGSIPEALPTWDTEVTLNAYPVLRLF
jgi:hypothetical protein